MGAEVLLRPLLPRGSLAQAAGLELHSLRAVVLEMLVNPHGGFTDTQ